MLFVVGDTCGDRHASPHDANLFDIQAKCGELVSTERIIQLVGQGGVALVVG